MEKNNNLIHSNNVKPYSQQFINNLEKQTIDWNKLFFNDPNNIVDEEFIKQQLKEFHQLNGTTIDTETQPQKEKNKKKCKVKCGCPCKKRIDDLEAQVDILLDMVDELMEDSTIFY